MGSCRERLSFGADNIATADGAVDTISGGDGNDSLYFDESDASSLTVTNLDGGAGADSANAVTNAGAVKVNATLANLETVIGAAGNDEITAAVRPWQFTCGERQATTRWRWFGQRLDLRWHWCGLADGKCGERLSFRCR